MNQKQAKELVRSRLSDKRYEHTLNVRKMAVKLAKRHDADEDRAARAGKSAPPRCGTASAPPSSPAPSGG